MEAIAAFSLACNVLQILDSAASAVSLGLEVYKNGVPADNAELERTSKHLSTLCTGLNSSLTTTRSSSSADGEVRLIAVECSATVEKLEEELRKLQPTGTRWKAVLKTAQIMRARAKIERIGTKIERYQALLDTGVLIRLSEQNDAIAQTQKSGFHQLNQTLQTFIQNLADQQGKVVDHVTKKNKETQDVVRYEHHQTRSQLDDQFQALRLDESRSQVYARFLASLRFDNIFDRQNQVSETASETFRWVFEDQAHDSWPSLTKWLAEGSGPYRVQGKAGSGKSTFMRFILEHERTKEHLRIWASQTQPKLVSHFFWRAGTPAQSSLKGFLCSMLYQILDDEPGLLAWALNHHSAMAKKYSTSDWNNKQLGGLLLDLLHNNPQSDAYLILIDGLDELYDNDYHASFFELLDKLFSLNSVKVCVAHRPEPDLERFLGHTKPLKLQDLTYRDISIYTEARFMEMMENLECDVDNDSLKKVTSEVTHRSDGVFLWVRLVLEDIERGLKRRDTLDDLWRRLLRLPTDIEKLYENMLERLGEDWQIYQREAAFYLRACYLISTHQSWANEDDRDHTLSLGGELSILSMSIAFDCQSNSTEGTNDSMEYTKSLRDRCKRLQSRIPICCSGLLELQPDHTKLGRIIWNWGQIPEDAPDVAWFHATKVSFTHRTVYDFLRTPSGTSILAKSDVKNDRIFLSVVQSHLTCLLSVRTAFRFDHLDIISDHISLGAHEASYDPDTVWSALLMLKKFFVLSAVPKNLRNDPEGQRTFEFYYFQQHGIFSDFTGYIISRGFDEAFAYGFKDVIQHGKSHQKRFNPTYINHLLDCAVSRTIIPLGYPSWPDIKWQSLYSWRCFFDAGADLNAEVLRYEPWIKGYTLKSPWTRFLETDYMTSSIFNAEMDLAVWQCGARLPHRSLVAITLNEVEDHISISPMNSGWQTLGSMSFVIIFEAGIELLLRNRIPYTSIQRLIADGLVPSKLDSKPKPLLIIPEIHEPVIRPRSFSNQDEKKSHGVDGFHLSDDDDPKLIPRGITAGIVEPQETCSLILAFMKKYESYIELHAWDRGEDELYMEEYGAYEDEQREYGMDGQNNETKQYTSRPRLSPALRHEADQIFQRSRKTTLREWMIEQGHVLPPDHPDVPKGPYKQFDDVADEQPPSTTAQEVVSDVPTDP